MQKRQLVFDIQGMAQDVLKPEVNSKFAYTISNMRLTATKDSQLLSLTTEKGTKALSTAECLETSGGVYVPIVRPLVGTFLGACIIDENLILFTKHNGINPDRIYRLFFNNYGNGNDDLSNSRISYRLLYQGNLNFSLDHPIEAIASYENEVTKKVYWIDGLNQPRILNIDRTYMDPSNNYLTTPYNYDPFSFTQEISLGNTNSIDVTKEFFGGLFYAGVVQYAYCYYKTNSQESNIVDFTPIYYISFSDRGEEPGKQVSCSFKITIQSNAEDVEHFDYIRVYQIYSSSLEQTPNVKIIKDIDTSILNAGNQYTYTFSDTNEFQVDASEYDLQMIKQFIIPQTITFKDNTLFFGNYKSNFVINKTDLSTLKRKPAFVRNNTRILSIDDKSDDANVYKYYNQLDKSSQDIKTFKYGEHYKFGLQFQNKYGQWSEPYFLADVTNNVHVGSYNYGQGTCQIPFAQLDLSEVYATITASTDEGEKSFVKVRPVVSFPTQNERLILCQGVLNPTVFNISDRANGTSYSQASWFFRPYPSYEWSENSGYVFDDSTNTSPATQWYRNGATCQFKHFNPLFPSDDIGGELQNMYFDTQDSVSNSTVGDLAASIIDKMFWLRRDTKNFLMPIVRQAWGVGCNLQNDWTLGSIHTTSWNTFQGHDYKVKAEVLEVRYNPNNAYIGWMKLEITVLKTVAGGYTDFNKSGKGDIMGSSISMRPKLNACDLGSVESPTSTYQNYYYVDQSVVTLNSPDIEFDTGIQSADLSQYSVRIIGYIPMFSNAGNYAIQASTPLFKMNWASGLYWLRGVQLPTGYYKKLWQVHNRWNRVAGQEMVCARGCWFDDINGVFLYEGDNHTGWNHDSQEVQYYVYPWQRQYLNNYNHNSFNASGSIDPDFSIEDIESSKIIKKTLANIRFSENTIYLDSQSPLDVDGLNIFNYDQEISVKLTNDKFYQANVDKLIVTTSSYLGNQFNGQKDSHNNPTFSDSTPIQGYPIVVGGAYNKSSDISLDTLIDYYKPRLMGNGGDAVYRYSPNESSADPLTMQYKSTPHIVFKLHSEGKTQTILPIGRYNGESSPFKWNQQEDWSSGEPLIWNQDTFNTIQQDEIDIATNRGYLWVGEIYRQNQNNSFGNNDEFSLQQRDWVIAGEAIDLTPNGIVKWLEGDTFYQRYDCLKTVPFSKEDYQSVVEILSFMCETRVNLDGRYDKNRGLLDNTMVDDTTFNLINPIYGQQNNFYTYNILDKDIFNVNNFSNQITWTLPKSNGAKTDNCTNITLASTIDADGTKGEISALRKFRDDIYCFQDNGIGKLLYNERVQIPTSDGIPIEIGNSNKMQGIRYISDLIGCQNKWACRETPSGIYFVDNNTPGLYQLQSENEIINLTKQKYMQKWFEGVNKRCHGKWNVTTAPNFQVLYDQQVDEVLLAHGHTDKLAFSPQLKYFTSFYTYTQSPFIGSLGKNPIALQENCSVHLLRSGLYSKFFERFETYGVEVMAYPFSNEQFVKDCIYDNVWYKADGFDQYDTYLPNETFDMIHASNEYQRSDYFGGDQLVYTNTTNHTNTNLRKKFRLWYARIPRDYNGANKHRDRMRNPWLLLRLTKTHPTGNAIRLQELMIDCYY